MLIALSEVWEKNCYFLLCMGLNLGSISVGLLRPLLLLIHRNGSYSFTLDIRKCYPLLSWF